MERGIYLRARCLLEPGLWRIRGAMDESQRTRGRPERHRVYRGARQRCHIAQGPCRTEQRARARVGLREADALVGRVRREGGAVRIVAAADGARADAMQCMADEGARGLDLIGQRRERFHHRAIVGRVHDGAGGVDHEVEQVGRRPLAVQLGEEREHPAAQFDAGESRARGRVQGIEWRRGRALSCRQHRLKIADGADRDRGKLQARLGHQRAEALQFGGVVADARDHDLERGAGAGLLGQHAKAIQILQAVARARIEVAHQYPRPEPPEQRQALDRMLDLAGRHAHADGGHGPARDGAELHADRRRC